MENKINIAELLKDCPQGMELDCKVFDAKVIYQGLNKRIPTHPIVVQTEHGFEFELTQYGQIHNIVGSKCVIFPKGKTTWIGYVPPCEFKDGDIVATSNGMWIGITTGGKNGSSMPTYCVIQYDDKFEAYFNRKETWLFNRRATEEEKAKLFQAIKDNGYKWNAETKTLEKLIEPKFKVGDRIKTVYNPHQYVIKGITDTHYTLEEVEEKFKYTEPIIEDKNWELVPNKFDITTLIPFESRVLVRDSEMGIWLPDFFGCFDNSNDCTYMVVGGLRWKCCIPYEGNEYLLGKCDDCIDFYKNW